MSAVSKFAFVLMACFLVASCSPEERVEVFGNLFGDRTRLEKQCVSTAMYTARTVIVRNNPAATARNLRGIPLKYCPPDFNEAAMSAIQSIEQLAALQVDRKKIESAAGGAFAASVLGFGFVGDAHDRKVREFNSKLRSASSRYEEAIDRVEVVAARYGVRERLPR